MDSKKGIHPGAGDACGSVVQHLLDVGHPEFNPNTKGKTRK